MIHKTILAVVFATVAISNLDAQERKVRTQSNPSEFGLSQSGFVESTEPAAASEFVSRHRPQSLAQSPEDLAAFEQYALTHAGDAIAGAKLFHDLRTRCSTCHRVGKEGGQVGPDLSNIGGKLDRPHLIDSLLYPSRQIGYGYETTTVLTVDGKVFNGITKQSDDSHITIVDGDAKRLRLPKTEIIESRGSTTSMIPTGLTKLLNQQEFTDLVTYLESLGPGNGKILRLNPDGSIPDDNPLRRETSGKYQAIWAKGCRNPFTFAFNQTGDMLINDVGGKFEEINRGIAGANYGWPEVDHGPTAVCTFCYAMLGWWMITFPVVPEHS